MIHHSSKNVCFAIALCTAIALNLDAADGDHPVDRDLVRVAAVQISGYDKGDLPRQGYDPAKTLVPYIDQAGRDGAQLVVFPEYVLGRIQVPGPESDTIAAAAKANSIYVIVGCWELFDNGTFANTALIFDRKGEVFGKYRKTHAAIDHFDGEHPPWSRPPFPDVRLRVLGKSQLIHSVMAQGLTATSLVLQ